MKQPINDHLLSLSWLFFLLFPNNNIFFVLVPIVYIILIDTKKRINELTFDYVVLFVILMITAFVININQDYLDFKSIARVAVLILIFISFGRLKGGKILAPYIIIAITFLVISQFISILNIPIINTIINRFYISSEGENLIDTFSTFGIDKYGSEYRLGGIYFNPNNYASYLELILAVLLCEIKQFKKIKLFFLILLIVFSIIATGSRTSFIVLLVMTLFFLYSSKILSQKKAILIIFSAILIGILIIININLSEFRAFKIGQGLGNSFGVKVEVLIKYINSNVPIPKLIFGSFSGAAIKKYTAINFFGTDFEIGNLIVYFGFFFLAAILIFYSLLFKKISPKYRVIFIILLWMFSNSILLSYRMAAVWMLVLGLYYQRSLKEKA